MLAQSGKTFRDGDGDGIKDSGEAGIPGVLVKSYINNGAGDLLLGQAVSNDTGFYNLTPPAGAGQKVRIEFQIPANACNLSNAVDFSSLGGQNYGSSVQFVTGPATNVHFAILNADAYVVSANPRLFVPCYVNGSNAKNTTSGNLDALVSYGYNSAGVPMMDGGTAPNPVPLAHGSSIGTVWGTAYSRQAKRLFTAAFLKRHSGLGPAGSGGIYLIDPANPPPTGVVPAHVSLDSLGFPTQGGGAYVATPTGFNPNIGSSANRGLPVGGPTPNADPSAFGQVGKVSLGGLDLSSDGRYLFTINLYDRKLYRLDLTNANAPVLNASTPVKQYNALPWLTAQCDSGMARPFAVKYYRGKVYVGVVCTGELKKFPRTPSLKRYADALRAYVYEIDPVTEAATVVLNFPLNYQKETLGSGAADSSPQNGWFTWSDNYRDHYYIPYCCGNQGFVGYNQPMLSDLEFDSDGSLILAFMDRGGHQWGFENFDPDGKGPGANGSGNYDKVTGGDILRTFKNPQTCTYQLEANGVAGPYTSTSLNPVTVNGIVSGTGVGTPNGTGLSFTGYTTPGKEFYWGDYAFIFGNNYPNPHHNEGIMGGLAIWPSSGEVIATGLDPVQNVAYSGGTYRLDNSTGARNIPTGYNIYSNSNTNPTFGLLGKANGLGDTEITGDVPPLEVGNRLWKDLDGDGIQDPDEPGINGVKIELYDNQGNKIAETTTANGGQYYFRAFTNLATSLADSIRPNNSYKLKIGTTDFSGGLGTGNLAGLKLTQTDQGGSGLADHSDNDATLEGGKAVISFTTGAIGQSDHTRDFGVQCTGLTISAQATPATCNGTNPASSGKITVGATGADKVAYSASGTPFYSQAVSYAGLAGGVLVSNLPNPATAAGQVYTLRFYGADSTCFKDTTLTLPFTDCSCNKPSAGNDQTACVGVDSLDLDNATGTQTWQLAAAYNLSINATSGVVKGAGLAVPGTYSFILTAKGDAAVCSDTVKVIIAPKPTIALAPNFPACRVGAAPTYSIRITTDQAPGTFTLTTSPANVGILAADSISGILTSVDSFYVKITANATGCRDSLLVKAPNCTVYDLALTKAISKSLARVGDTLTYTISVINQGTGQATGVTVLDTLNSGVQYLSSTADQGSYNPLTHLWNVDSVAVGDTVRLFITVKVLAQGLWHNTAEIKTMNETDKDSTPGNGKDEEDDIDRRCFTVPFEVCSGEMIEAVVPNNYTGVVWFRAENASSTPIQVATNTNTYTITGPGYYTFTASVGTCPSGGCCPIIVVADDCCKPDICVPFTISKTKRLNVR